MLYTGNVTGLITSLEAELGFTIIESGKRQRAFNELQLRNVIPTDAEFIESAIEGTRIRFYYQLNR